jgi:aspartate aminotransferase
MWDDREAALAEPLERFAALHAKTLRGSPAGVLDLSYPNPRADRDPRAFELLRDVLGSTTQDDLQYTPLGGGTVVRRRIASALSRQLDLRLGYRDVLLTPGATTALTVALAALFRSGDQVLVVTPCWMDYPLYLNRLGLDMVPVPSGPDKRLDVDAVSAACGPNTAGVIISQPACPTGVVHSAEELAALGAALGAAAQRFGHHPVLLSDEVHRDQVWDGDPMVSPMQVYPDTISIHSFGKAWSLQGQRTGYLALGPASYRHDESVVRIERAVRSTGACAPTALMQRLVLEIVDLLPDNGSLRAEQIRARELLADLGCRVVAGRATAFVYARCPAEIDDWEFVTRLARQGVLAMPSSVFHEIGYFRIALNVGAEQWNEVARRLRGVLPGPQEDSVRHLDEREHTYGHQAELGPGGGRTVGAVHQEGGACPGR